VNKFPLTYSVKNVKPGEIIVGSIIFVIGGTLTAISSRLAYRGANAFLYGLGVRVREVAKS